MKQMLAHFASTPTHLKTLCQSALQVMLGACMLTLASQIALTVPYSCVPFTLQAQAVLLLAVLFGPERALQSVLAFLSMGACGLPVFSQGCGSIGHLLGPRGGYLMSYVLVAPLVSRLVGASQSFWPFLGALLLGNALLMLVGFLWLSGWIGLSAAFMTGVLPFILSDFAKTLLVALGTYWQKRALSL